MNMNQLMTYGALAFAGYALWQFKRPSQALANQPGQQQRDAALLTFNQQQLSQWEHMAEQLQTDAP